MELQHVNVKVFVDGALPLDPGELVPVFHDWIREERFDELLIDVADYRHVPAGPGVLLIGLEADYSLDHESGRWGMRYNRKAALDGDNRRRLRQALGAALSACRLLERRFDAGASLRFSRQDMEIFVNDRALAPNTADTFRAASPDLETFLGEVLGHTDFSLTHRDEPRDLFRVLVHIERPFDPETVARACQ